MTLACIEFYLLVIFQENLFVTEFTVIPLVKDSF